MFWSLLKNRLGVFNRLDLLSNMDVSTPKLLYLAMIVERYLILIFQTVYGLRSMGLSVHSNALLASSLDSCSFINNIGAFKRHFL